MKNSMSNGKPFASAIDPDKKYTVSYLAPHQSQTKKYEYGASELYGRDLTEKQIVELNEKGWLGNKVQCDLCGNEWVAVYHEDCDKLECPNCNNISHFETID